MPDPRETEYMEYIDKIRANGVRDDGQPSFLRDWEPVGYLGHGSYGVVYEIRRGGQRCAVKIIDMSNPNIDYSVEINALNMLKGQKHATNIFEYAYVSIKQGGFTNRYLLIRMNLLSDLPDSMTEDEVIDMGAQICDVLAVCHSGETKLYHCDIKPENILVAGDGTYILSDFGASNITQRSHKSSGHAGTPLYEAPEMLRFESFDGRSDLFSLGISMYALLNNGLPPFAKNDNDAEAIRIRLEGKRNLPAINGVSGELMKIIRKACASDADKRYKSAAEMKSALTALSSEREAKRKAEEEKRKAEENKRTAGQESEKRQKAETVPESGVYGKTQVPGENKPSAPVKQTSRKPLVIIATAVALVAAIVCGSVWLPGIINPIKFLTDITDVSVGDHVYFGYYPQKKDGTVRPIEWRVLDIEDGNALMISEYLLDAMPYNDEDEDVTWETCTLREWLNNDFYNTAFLAYDQNRIVLRENENQGNWTNDNVFCLSKDEAEKYFSGNDDRKAKPTAYAIERGAQVFKDIKMPEWWLRSAAYTEEYGHFGTCVNTDGHIAHSYRVDGIGNGVRPAILVSLSGDAQQTEQDTQQTTWDAQQIENLPALADLSSVAVGDHVKFGSYPQTEDGEEYPIEWRVLDVEDGNALMISEYLPDVKRYNETDAEVTWETCDLREWVNGTFYDTAFTAEEKNRVILRVNEDQTNPEYGTEGGNTTEDRVFCLSMDEADKYFSSDEDRQAQPTPYAIKNGAQEYKGNGSWWLRSPGCSGEFAANVVDKGAINEHGGNVFYGFHCVRPAILVSLSEVTQQTSDLPALADLSSVSVGDHVTFGSYPQTENGEVQPIEWRVLDIKNGNALMISEYLLDAHRFDDDSNDWQSSELRAWLNEDFLNKAFSSAEQQRLGEVDGDKVTCLSIDEVKKYFGESTEGPDGYLTCPDCMAAPTAYARKKGTYILADGDMGWWWLRSPGNDNYPAVIYSDGVSYFAIYYVFDDGGRIRPVVSVSLSAES